MTRFDISSSEKTFGEPAKYYGPIVASSLPNMLSVKYIFWNEEIFRAFLVSGQLSISHANVITAFELVQNAHLAATTSIVRACRWFEASHSQYQMHNLLGWSACLRSLIEAVGDSVEGLHAIPVTLANHASVIVKCLSGDYSEGFVDFSEVEASIEHYYHARKIEKSLRHTAPTIHNAKPTFEYIRSLETAGMSDIARLYGELCEISHPARDSIEWMVENRDFGYRLNPEMDSKKIEDIILRYKNQLSGLPSLSFNPGLLIARSLVKIGWFPSIPTLKNFSFQGAKSWSRLKPILEKLPPAPKRYPLIDELFDPTLFQQ